MKVSWRTIFIFSEWYGFAINANISALLSENVGKFEFLTGKDVLPEKGLLEEEATMQWFEYLALGKKLKAQTNISKKQYHQLNKLSISDEKEEPTFKKYNKSDLIYNSKYSFYKYYCNSNSFDNLSNQNTLF